MANPNTRETLKQYALRTLGKPVIEINVDDSNNTIVNKLKKYLDNQDELKKVTDRGWLLMNKYTQDWYASVFINKMTKILNS